MAQGLPKLHFDDAAFKAQLEAVYQKLWDVVPAPKPEKPALDWVVTDNNNPSIILSENTVVFSAALLAELESEAQLASLLAVVMANSQTREFSAVREKWQEILNAELKGKSPEAASRLRKVDVSTPSAVRWIRESGYDVQALATYIEQSGQKIQIGQAGLRDPFLIAVTATNEVFGTQARVAEEKQQPAPSQGSLIDAKARRAGSDHMAKLRERQQEFLAEEKERWDGYDVLSFPEKCDLLKWAVRTAERAKPKPLFEAKDIAERIKALDLKTVSDEDRPHVEGLIKEVINTSTPEEENLELNPVKAAAGTIHQARNMHGKLFYDALVRAETGEKPKKSRPLVGQGLKELEGKIQQFIKAEDDEEIKQLAGEILQLAEDYPIAEAGIYIRFSSFSWPDGMENAEDFIAPSWEKHVKVNSPQVNGVLGFLGVAGLDPRLYKTAGKRHVSVDLLPPVVKGREIFIQQDGSIKAVPGREKEAFLKAYTQNQAEQERAFVGKTDWKELETDLQGFVEKHEGQLNPNVFLFKVSKGLSDSDNHFLKRLSPLERQVQKRMSRSYSIAFTMMGHEETSAVSIDKGQVFLETFLQKASEIKTPAFQREFADFLEQEITGKMLPANHPYLGTYLALDIVPDEQKYAVLEHVEFWEWNRDTFEDEWQFPFMDKLGYSSDNASLDKLETFLTDNRTKLKHAGYRAQQAIISYAAYDTVKQLDKLASLDEVRFIRDLGEQVGYQRRRAFRAKASELVPAYAEGILQSGKIQEQVELYKALSSRTSDAAAMIDEMPELRKQCEENFRSHIETKLAGSAEERAEANALMLDLLVYQPDIREKSSTWNGSREAFYESVNLNTDFGNWVADTYLSGWVQDFIHAHGNGQNSLQDGQTHKDVFVQALDTLENTILTPELRQSIGLKGQRESDACEHMARLFERMSGKKLGNELLLQAAGANALQEKIDGLRDVGERESTANDRPHWKTGNAILDKFITSSRNSAQHREVVKDFLVLPYSEKNAKRMVKYLARVGHDVGDASKEKQMEWVKDAHEKFWQLGFDARTAAMAYVLNFDLGADMKEAVREVAAYAIPRPHALASDRKQMLRARDITSAYVEACAPPKRAALLASMLVAGKPGASASESHPVGEALNLILGSLGPAGDKLRQAIESYPATPVEIKQELQGAKTEARDLSRDTIWKLVERSNEDVPESGHKAVCVGKVLGAGSYGVTVEVEREDGKRVARTLLYDGVLAQAETQFDTMRKAMEILKERDPEFARMLSPLVEQASHMLRIELDMALAEEQTKTAELLYSTVGEDGKRKPVSVRVDGREVRSFAAPFAGRGVSGSTYKDAEIVEGVHFLDLVKEAAESRKKAGNKTEKMQTERDLEDVSASLLMLEASFLLRGMTIDHDRHGGQQCIQKIEENGKTRFEVGQFDFGALEMEMCNARQKQMIGHALAGLMYDLEVKGKDFGKALQNAMRDIPQTPEEETFMAQTQRGVLAWGNFVSGLGKDKDLGHILGALYNQGYIDADVEKAMRERLGKYADKAFAELKEKGDKSGLELDSKPPVELFKKPGHEWELREDAPSLGKGLDAIPVTDKQIRNAGIGAAAVAAAAGVGTAVHLRNKKKEQQAQEQTPAQLEERKAKKKNVMRRVVRVMGAAISVVGMAMIADVLASGGKNTRNIVGSVVGDKNARIFQPQKTAIFGAAIMGTGMLTALLAKKRKHHHEPEQQQAQDWQQRQRHQERPVASSPSL